MTDYSFTDLFAGIGGFRIAFEKSGGECVFSAENDRFAQKTYEAFFGERPDFSCISMSDLQGDLALLSPELIPDHDILTAGFPCQPFSLAGVSKKKSLGRLHGFEDPTQGTLFFNLKEIIKKKQPKAFLLENVKHLKSHDKGNTVRVIMETLEKKLKYTVEDKIIDGAHWVPQHRERIFFVGFHPDLNISKREFKFPDPPRTSDRISLEEILENDVDHKYTLGRGTWRTLVRHKRFHSAAGRGFGYTVIEPPYHNKITRTISARYNKDGAEVLIYQGEKKRPRRLTPLECSKLMGFPEKYQKFFDPNCSEYSQPVSDTQAYRQFGNSVIVPLVSDIAKYLIDFLKSKDCLD